MTDTIPTKPATEPCFWTMRQLATALRTRQIGALEMLDLLLARVAEDNPAINAIVALDIDTACAAARQADARLTRRDADLPPLLGVPMTIKDTFAVRSMPSTGGIPAFADYRPTEDAEAVARLRAAGAVIFGKTNVPIAASDHQSYNDIYGLTRNPWNLTRTVGGSSGGSAAALAAGFTPLEFGSDIGGSIRVPAHCCGVFGHKSSFGLVSGRGHIPPAPGVLHRPELSVAGPMARSAFDLEDALDLLAAPDAARAGAWSVRLPAARREHLGEFRVALWNDDAAFPLDADCRTAIAGFADDLRHLGVAVDEAARPAFDAASAFETYLAVLMGIIGNRLPEAEIAAMREAAAGCDPANYPARIVRYATQSAREAGEWAERREHLFVAWRDFFTRYDALICPVLPTVAFPHDTAGQGIRAQFSRSITVNGAARPYFDNLMWPGLITVANLPATAIPTGRFVDGLPVGVQIVGPYLEDRTTLRLAQLIESRLGLFAAPPRPASPPQSLRHA